MTTLSNIDLNLLRLFSVLYETQSVSVAADRLNLSQSACSHALTRLRDRLGDELFVRVGNTMLPTEYAKNLITHVVPALDMIRSGLNATQAFSVSDPHIFKVAVTDYTAWCMRSFIGIKLVLIPKK